MALSKNTVLPSWTGDVSIALYLVGTTIIILNISYQICFIWVQSQAAYGKQSHAAYGEQSHAAYGKQSHSTFGKHFVVIIIILSTVNIIIVYYMYSYADA